MKSKRHAFTLVELLVVLAVVSILMSLLYPMVARAMNMAKHSGCVANIRTLAQGMSAYAYDNEGKLPAPGWGSAADNWLSSDYKLDKPEDVRTGQIWQYITNQDAYRCPADTPPNTNIWMAIHNIQPKNCYKLSSYCMNGSVIAYGGNRTGYSPTVTNRKRNTLHIELFSGEDIMYWEADETRIARGMWWDASNFPFEGMSGRHRTWGSIGCIDGHAEKLTRDDYYNVEAPGNVGRTRLWNVPPQFSGNGH